MTVQPSQKWYRALNDILDASISHKQYEDFIKDCKLQPSTEMGFLERNELLQKLIQNKNIGIVDGRLVRLEVDSSFETVLTAISNGCEMGIDQAWEVFEKLQPNSRNRNKFDQYLLKKIGLEGELFVLDKLKEKLPESIHQYIDHVSLKTDLLGYDILGRSLTNSDRKTFLEVKTYSGHSSSKFVFYISANEIDVAERSPDWYLVAVERKNSALSILGHIRHDRFIDAIPINNPSTASIEGSWQSTMVKIDRNLFIPELP
jgi:hypothetical protein